MQAKRTCSLPDCDDLHYGLGYCRRHYDRWKRLGATELRTPEDRFWAKVNKQGPVPQHRPELGPCWLWTGAAGQSGHGQFYCSERRAIVPAYRWAYEHFVDPIPEGLEPDHLCRVPACVRPLADEFGLSHLEPVTHAENLLRAPWSAIQWQRAKTHCKHGHPFSGDNLLIVRYSGRTERRCRTCDTTRQANRRR